MDISRILGEIDAQIASLQQARAILGGTETPVAAVKPKRGRPKSSSGTNAEPAKAKRGRPKGSGNKTASVNAVAGSATPAKRTLSPAGRKAIADAMKKRWAERKKTQ